MKCPWCKKEFNEVEESNGFRNADVYNNVSLVRAKCCGKGVNITPVRSYRLSQYLGSDTEDDWGNPINQAGPDYQRVKRGDQMKGSVVLSFFVRRGGGVGMGEYPETRTFTLQDGSVWQWTDPGWLEDGTENPVCAEGPL